MNQYDNDIETLFRSNYARLYHYAMQMIDDGELCRDIIADVFEQLWRQWDRIPDNKRNAMLYRSVHNRCIDHIRKLTTRQNYIEFFKATFSMEADSALNEDSDSIRFEKIEKAIGTLPEIDQTIINRAFIDGRRYADIAEELQISLSSIKKHIAKAILKIRTECENNS